MTEFKTDISKQGKQFELVFTTDNKEHFNKVQSVARDCIDHKSITQFDRIKAMSVEELTNFLFEWGDHNITICNELCGGYKSKCGRNCVEKLKKWLESEVQGE